MNKRQEIELFLQTNNLSQYFDTICNVMQIPDMDILSTVTLNDLTQANISNFMANKILNALKGTKEEFQPRQDIVRSNNGALVKISEAIITMTIENELQDQKNALERAQKKREREFERMQEMDDLENTTMEIEVKKEISKSNLELKKKKNELEKKQIQLKNEEELNDLKEENEKKYQRIVPISNYSPSVDIMFGSSIVSGTAHRATLLGFVGCNFLNLVYRASIHGYTASAFHGNCNGMVSTLVIIRSSNGYIFGGYNPQSWENSGTVNGIVANSAFIFTLTNPHGIIPTKYFYNSNSYACYNNSTYGPTFGGGHDICVYNDMLSDSHYTNFPHTFSDSTSYGKVTFTGKYNFTVADIEVYKCIF